MQKVEFAAEAREIENTGEEAKSSGEVKKRRSVAKRRPAARYRAAAGCGQAPAAFDLAGEFFGGISMYGGTPRVRPAIENGGIKLRAGAPPFRCVSEFPESPCC